MTDVEAGFTMFDLFLLGGNSTVYLKDSDIIDNY
jgi:hypothetical protein